MQRLETYLGSAVWMALSFVMVFAALEPVELPTRTAAAAQVAAADCGTAVGTRCVSGA